MKALSYLNKFFIKYKWLLIGGFLFILISNYFAVKMAVYVGNATDSIKEMIKGKIDKKIILNSAISFASFYVLFSFLKGFFLFLQRQTIIIASRRIEYDLKNEVYDQYQKLDSSFYQKNNTGDLLNRISEDVGHVRMYLGPGIMYTINLIVLFFMILFYMIKINGIMTLFVLLPLPIMSILIYFVSSKMNKQSKIVQEEQSNMSTLVQETFSGIRVVRAYNKEQEKFNRFSKSSNAYLKKTMNLTRTNALFMPTIIFLIGSSVLLTIYLGGVMVSRGNITVGEIVTFILYVNMLTWPFASVGWVTSLTQRAAASQTRINEFLKVESKIISPTTKPFEIAGTIEFKNVTLTYPGTEITALKNITFKINKGETVAFIGRTGSGKSSILQLMTRMIDPTSGNILIDEVNLKEINLDNFRRDIGFVPQDVFLFSDTIGNNLRFGVNEREVSEEELKDIAIKTHVYHNIQEFPEQFETILGERGVNLSGGQKQRISIGRALIRKPKILLLDDCLSAVDTETEDIILRNLTEVMHEKTTVIVSHRISSIRNAQKIYVLDGGRIVEQGNHGDLLNQGGIYSEMYQNQLIEE